jgi:hypothetical protein
VGDLRIAVVGDTHGKIERIKKSLHLIQIDHMLFTGDYYSDGEKIACFLGIDFHGVAGNCDPGLPTTKELCLDLAGKSFYIVHGHRYGVKRGLKSLFYRGKEVGADVVLFGHTHIPFCKKIDNIWMINPGSPSQPRGGQRRSYALLEIKDNILSPEIVYLKSKKVNN